MSQTIVTISLENLLIDLINPRYPEQANQRESIATIAKYQGVKLINLAEDIAEKGLNPSELPLVAETDKAGIYVVLEGNRRIAALKLATTSQLLDSIELLPNVKKRFKKLNTEAISNFPRNISCAVLTREEARHWIGLKHSGERDGVGVVSWDGIAAQRFRGNSPSLEVIDLVENNNYVDDETKKKIVNIPITNIERILGSPEARELIGVDVKKKKLIITGDKNETIARLSTIVGDIAHGRKNVSDLDTKDQIVKYAREISTQPLPQSVGTPKGNSGPISSPVTPTKPLKPVRPINPVRNTLIPKQFKFAIKHTRLNQIYHELCNLEVDSFTNSCAVMLRVFIELTLDEYARRHKISFKTTPKPSGTQNASIPKGALKPKDMTLREKIDTIIKHFEQKNLCDPNDLRGIKMLLANRDHVISVTSLNAYVHNQNYNPAPSDLKAQWDSIEVFIQHLWTI
jgi:hypothetical protein